MNQLFAILVSQCLNDSGAAIGNEDDFSRQLESAPFEIGEQLQGDHRIFRCSFPVTQNLFMALEIDAKGYNECDPTSVNRIDEDSEGIEA